MAVVVKKFRVNTGHGIYLPGELISDLDEKTEKQLVDAGHCEFVQGHAVAPGNTQPAPVKADLLTIEQFTALKASEQKTILQRFGIESGSNEEQRVQQYTQWYEQQASGGEADENGPNTGMSV
ncbi:hypothetical protein [Brevibacillus sp. H7]|uniref:hypothetical protein n=1 Tax=Brevibacillus sp. H7 TaxID=3349138 RepID=UPI003801EAFE